MNRVLVYLARRIEGEGGLVLLVHGDCPTGADRFADLWAIDRIVPVERHRVPAGEWDRTGPSAGPARNERMVRRGARVCLSFEGGTGTADCTRRARRAGIRTLLVRGTVEQWAFQEVGDAR